VDAGGGGGRSRFRERLAALSPEHKDRFRRLQRRLPSRVVDRLLPAVPTIEAVEPPPRPPVPSGSVRLLVAPANFAGQGWEWARAAERYLPGVAAQCFAFEREAMPYHADYSVPVAVYRSQEWMREQERYVVEHFTHVLIEAMRPVLGPLYGGDASGEVPVLSGHGLAVALLCHGSDVRLPSRHSRLYAWSPFHDPGWAAEVAGLEKQALRLGRFVRAYQQAGGRVYVSTPDLLDDVPGATWLPVVVEMDRWRNEAPVLQRPVPVVVHAPSHSRIKGTEAVEAALLPLHDRGVIEYRRIERLAPQAMPEAFASADVVVDQLRLGSYGVAACEAMAAGRVVVGHVDERVRARVGRRLPIIEATPATLADTITDLVRDRDRGRGAATESVPFVQDLHDGRRSAAVLGPWLMGEPSSEADEPGQK